MPRNVHDDTPPDQKGRGGNLVLIRASQWHQILRSPMVSHRVWMPQDSAGSKKWEEIGSFGLRCMDGSSGPHDKLTQLDACDGQPDRGVSCSLTWHFYPHD